MAVASPPPPATFSAASSFTRATTLPSLARFPHSHPRAKPLTRPLKLTLSARVNSTSLSSRVNSFSPDSVLPEEEGDDDDSEGGGGELRPGKEELDGELLHPSIPPRREPGSPVYVTLPAQSVDHLGQLRGRKRLTQSLKALAAAGVAGVVMEVWWGIVEKDEPEAYNWQGYLDIVHIVRDCGLKIRVVLAFHQYGDEPKKSKTAKDGDEPEKNTAKDVTGHDGKRPKDFNWIPLPLWVLDEFDKDPDLAYADSLGRRNKEYISLGCDTLPVLRGRSPLQAYADFMRTFRDTFNHVIGSVIVAIQIGMGPDGELRYPFSPRQKLTSAGQQAIGPGEYQCYDKYMLASLNLRARELGRSEYSIKGPASTYNLMHKDPKVYTDYRGSWKRYDHTYFFEWYSEMLILHGERICREAEAIFLGTEVHLSAKLAGCYWHYRSMSHASEATAGYYNSLERDGYYQIIRMFARHGFGLCCPCFDLLDSYEQRRNPSSSPERLLKQLISVARVCDIPVEGESSAVSLSSQALDQMKLMSQVYSYNLENPSFSFRFGRMDRHMFEFDNWLRFTRFLKKMSDADKRPPNAISDVAKFGLASAYC